MGTDVTDLEKSIQTLGLIAPLVISPDNVILAGARRYQALMNLGFTEAPVTVIHRGPLEKELVSIDENLVRKDLTKMEIESHLRRAKEIYQEINPVTVKEEEKDVVVKEPPKKRRRTTKKDKADETEIQKVINELKDDKKEEKVVEKPKKRRQRKAPAKPKEDKVEKKRRKIKDASFDDTESVIPTLDGRFKEKEGSISSSH